MLGPRSFSFLLLETWCISLVFPEEQSQNSLGHGGQQVQILCIQIVSYLGSFDNSKSFLLRTGALNSPFPLRLSATSLPRISFIFFLPPTLWFLFVFSSVSTLSTPYAFAKIIYFRSTKCSPQRGRVLLPVTRQGRSPGAQMMREQNSLWLLQFLWGFFLGGGGQK